MFIGLGATWLTIGATLVTIPLIVCWGILFWSHISRYIVIDEKRISVSKDKDGKFVRTVQYSASVDFQDIVDLRLLISTKDSRNEEQFGLFTPMIYLVIDCKDGSQRLFNLYYYSKKQIVALLDLLIARLQAVKSQIKYKTSAEILKEFNDNYAK